MNNSRWESIRRIQSADPSRATPPEPTMVDFLIPYSVGLPCVVVSHAVRSLSLRCSRPWCAWQGHIALARAVFPEDTMGSKLDVLARLALWEAGLDYRHGTGHGAQEIHPV